LRGGVGDVGDGGGCNDSDPAETAHDVDPDKHGAATDEVDQAGTDASKCNLDSVDAELNVGLGDRAANASGVKESGEVVGDNAWGIGVSLQNPFTEG
jgi:hypothetical protein